MRCASLILLFAGLTLGQESLKEVAHIQYDGPVTGICAVAAGEGYLPFILTRRREGPGQLRAVDLSLDRLFESKLSGVPLGMGRLGGGALLATLERATISFRAFEYRGTRPTMIPFAGLSVEALQDPRLLRLATVQTTPLAIIGHANGLMVASLKPRGRGTTDLIARPGRRYFAASDPFLGDADQRLDIYAASENGRLLQLDQDASHWRVAKDVRYSAPGFHAHALAGVRGRLFLGGSAGGEAQVLFFDTIRLRPFKVPKELRRLIRVAVRPDDTIALGTGEVDRMEVLDKDRLVLAGVKEGRAWVAVLRTGSPPTVEYEITLPGTGVSALGLNPKRKGWSIAAGTRERAVYLLRIPGDEALPANWSPWPLPQSGPPTAPAPQTPLRRIPGASATVAILPRIAIDARTGFETEIVMVYLGRTRRIVRVDYLSNTGRSVHSTVVRLTPWRRVRISVLRELGRHGVSSFDGYVRISGCPRAELVVEGVMRRGGPSGSAEVLRIHWR